MGGKYAVQRGIYRIVHNDSGKSYVGSAMHSIKKRWNEHRRLLFYGRHHSILLQRAWDKYGKDSFSFEILEIVENVDFILEREQYYLDMIKSYDPNYGYNICRIAGNTAGVLKNDDIKAAISAKKTGKKLTQEHKDKISKSQIGIKASDEHRANISKALKGRVLSEEHKQKISQARKGQKASPEVKQQISQRLLGNTYRRGKPSSVETKQKVSESLKGNRRRAEHAARLKAEMAKGNV